MKHALPYIIILVLASIILFAPKQKDVTKDAIRDTVFSTDTVMIKMPSASVDTIVRHERYLVTRIDTIRDTAYIYIPITQKVYRDSLYTAYVSGYNVNLDSIELYNRTRTIFVRGKPKRFGLGVQVGYGYPHGAYIGLGVSYNLFQW